MEDGSRGHKGAKGAISEVERMVKTAQAVVSSLTNGCRPKDFAENGS